MNTPKSIPASPPFSWKARGRSFFYAFAGIARFFRTGHNARLHGLAALLVALLAYRFGVSRTEAMALIFSIAFVWVAEMINTVFEELIDFITTDHHPRIKDMKDLAAGAVLTASVCALLVGAIIFIPKIFHL